MYQLRRCAECARALADILQQTAADEALMSAGGDHNSDQLYELI